MPAVLQTVSWWCFVPQHFSPEAFVRAVAEAGFGAIDLVPPEHWDLVKSHGLAISSIKGNESLTVGYNHREQHDALIAEMLPRIADAERLHVPNVLCFSGNRYGVDDTAAAEITADGLARLAPAAEDAGVTLVLELLNSKVDHPDYQADHTAWGVEVCRRVGSPHVKLLYDIYHMQIMEGDVIRTIRAAWQQIGLFHTAGNPGRNDLDDEQELNYAAIMRAIRATGFGGYVGHEFLPKGDAMAALRDTFAHCAAWLE